MRVYPSHNQQLLFIAVIEELAFIERLACVACASLFRYNEARDEERIGFEDAAEHAACFEVEASVGGGDVEELLAELGREEDGAEWVAVFEVSGGFEGEVVELAGWSGRAVVGNFAGERGCGGLRLCVFSRYRWRSWVLEDGVSVGGYGLRRERWRHGRAARRPEDFFLGWPYGSIVRASRLRASLRYIVFFGLMRH